MNFNIILVLYLTSNLATAQLTNNLQRLCEKRILGKPVVKTILYSLYCMDYNV